ncbi:hypothetical protein ACJ73_02851 [Blastomyces percursus]|uniref:Uncharacterized protein n=1 Tax=Blastomyces percursus TaxID=1658174 RepID=A0A1J9RDP1_9EURO|nr:hypothetical protein ACJ73_02851 [Blastomyces percursus]
MSPPAGSSSLGDDSSVTITCQSSQETLVEKESGSHYEPLSSQDAFTSVKLQGQDAQYSQHKFVVPFSKMVDDAILQSNIRINVEPGPEQHDSQEDHTPLPIRSSLLYAETLKGEDPSQMHHNIYKPSTNKPLADIGLQQHHPQHIIRQAPEASYCGPNNQKDPHYLRPPNNLHTLL